MSLKNLRLSGARMSAMALAIACIVVSAPAWAQSQPSAPAAPARLELATMTWNIANGQGLPNSPTKPVGKKYLNQVAQGILDSGADVVFLQEVSRNRYTTGWVDQAQYLARRTGMYVVWGPQKKIGPGGIFGTQGNAILSRYPITWSENHHYTAREKKGSSSAKEQRGVVVAGLDVNGTEVVAMSTHLGFGPSQTRQAEELAGIVDRYRDRPVVLGGDFNARPGSETMARIAPLLDDSFAGAANPGDNRTSPGKNAQHQIDFVFMSRGLFSPLASGVALDKYSKSSDHRAMLTRAAFHGAPPGAATGPAPTRSGASARKSASRTAAPSSGSR